MYKRKCKCSKLLWYKFKQYWLEAGVEDHCSQVVILQGWPVNQSHPAVTATQLNSLHGLSNYRIGRHGSGLEPCLMQSTCEQVGRSNIIRCVSQIWSDAVNAVIRQTVISYTQIQDIYREIQKSTQMNIQKSTAEHSSRTSVSDRQTFAVLRSTCGWRVKYVGKPSAVGQPTRPTQPFILSGYINE